MAKPKDTAAYEAQREKYTKASEKAAAARQRVKKSEKKQESLRERAKRQAKKGSQTALKNTRNKLQRQRKITRSRRRKLQDKRKTKRKLGTYTETTPGDPGELNPTISPEESWGPEEIRDDASKKAAWISELNAMEHALKQLEIDNQRATVDINQQERGGLNSANWEMAGRGLFGSGLRDAALFDISGAAERARQDLAAQYSAMDTDNLRRAEEIKGEKTAWGTELQARLVENAREKSEGMGEYAREPTGPTTQKYKVQPTRAKMNLRAPKRKLDVSTPKKKPARPNANHKKVAQGRMTNKPAQKQTGRMSYGPQG